MSCFSRQIAEVFAPAATRIAARATLLAEAAGNGGLFNSVLPGIGTAGRAFASFADATDDQHLPVRITRNFDDSVAREQRLLAS